MSDSYYKLEITMTKRVYADLRAEIQVRGMAGQNAGVIEVVIEKILNQMDAGEKYHDFIFKSEKAEEDDRTYDEFMGRDNGS